MKKSLMAVGIAAIAMASMGGGAQAGHFKSGWKHFHHNYHWSFHKKHHWGGPKKCFWVKKKKWGHHGWYFKKVYVCKDWRYYHY